LGGIRIQHEAFLDLMADHLELFRAKRSTKSPKSTPRSVASSLATGLISYPSFHRKKTDAGVVLAMKATQTFRELTEAIWAAYPR
jgi:hypothetical protein